MSTSLVGRTASTPWWIACSCVIRPPISVHRFVGSTRAISATFGHGSPQPPAGAFTSNVGRLSSSVPRSGPGLVMRASFREHLEMRGQGSRTGAVLTRIHRAGCVQGGERAVPSARDRLHDADVE